MGPPLGPGPQSGGLPLHLYVILIPGFVCRWVVVHHPLVPVRTSFLPAHELPVLVFITGPAARGGGVARS